MADNQNLELARWAVDQARKQGAGEAAVNISTERSIEVEIRAGKVEKMQEAMRSGLSLAVYADHRFSSHSTNDLRRDSLASFISAAVGMTKYLAPDPFRALPDPKYYRGQEQRALDLVDPAYERIDSVERVRRAKAMESAALAQSDKIISATTGYTDTFSRLVKVHSNGFEGQVARTSFTLFTEVTVKDENGRPEDYAYGYTRHWKQLPDPAVIGKEAATRALGRIGQRKIASGRYELLVENRSVSRLLGPVIGALSGSALQQKRSFLDGMLGKSVAHERLTVTDDPFLPAGAGSRLFDGEGIATRRRAVIEKGVLKTYFIDSYYGRKLGMEPTSGGASNLVFATGDKDLAALTRTIPKGILAAGFLGGNSNPTTGDYSFGITGFYVENGAILHPVNEMNISGNLRELWNNLAAVGSDPFPYGNWRTPALHFHDVQFSGL